MEHFLQITESILVPTRASLTRPSSQKGLAEPSAMTLFHFSKSWSLLAILLFTYLFPPRVNIPQRRTRVCLGSCTGGRGE